MNKKLVVLQEEISDCGVCSLLSIIKYYGGNSSLENLRILSNTTSNGVNAFNLIECAKEVGFSAYGLKLKGSEYISNTPSIAHLKVSSSLNHFVCVYKIKDSYILIMDPSLGFKKISKEEFDKMFTGVLIVLKPNTKIINDITPNSVKNNLFNAFKLRKKSIKKIIILNIIFIFLSIIYSFYIYFYDDLIFVLLYILLLILKNIFDYLINKQIIKIEKDISYDLTSNFINHVFKLPLKYLHIKEKGELIKRISDEEQLSITILNFILSILLNLIIIISIIIFCCFLNRIISIILIIFFIFYISFELLINKNLNIKIDEIILSETKYKSNLIDYVNGINSIKRSNMELKFIKQINNNYNYSLKNKENLKLNLNKKKTIKNIIIGLFELTINIILLNFVTIKMFVVINLLISLYVESVLDISSNIPSVMYVKKLIRKINEFSALKEEKNIGTNFKNGDITIKNLSYSYNNYIPVLKNVNLTIKKGEHIIIKGESGKGKSTLLKLLNKEDETYQGIMKINNINLKSIKLSEIRDNISYASQNEYIFYGTIKDNITNGKEISEEKLNEIINICCIDRIISKKIFGINTILFNNNDLSGGERELILLARALLKDASIIILDESLSEVNEELENQILNNILNFYKEKTIIYVTHKNSKNYGLKEITI